MEKTKEERILLLGNSIKLVMGICANIIKDIDILEDYLQKTSKNESFAASAAAVLVAAGIDFEEKEFNWRLQNKRTEALLNFVNVLKDTENERIEFNEKQSKLQASRDQLNNIFN